MEQQEINETSIFEYTKVPLPEDCIFKISPSAISKFFEMPIVWYKEQVTGEEKFEGSTASVLGSVVHALAEQYSKGEKSSREEVETYLRKQRFKPGINIDEIRNLYPDMAGTLINEYIRKEPKPTEIEVSRFAEVKDGVYVAGTLDRRTGSMVEDYKNVSTKPNTEKIPWHYYIQLMAYAWLCKQHNIEVDRIRIIYVVRPTKTLPVRLFKVTQTINEKDYRAIEDVLQLISDTILLSKEHPELNYLLFRSMQLKET
jgi:hypothetical protein